MKQLIKYSFIALCMMALPATASCFADYKAKKDDPLQLHYGVVELPNASCGSKRAARAAITNRLAAEGWTLLNVVSVFDESQLQQRKASAGKYFLRF